jgi:1-deoxy-D-xylulose-5-phosphate synthase
VKWLPQIRGPEDLQVLGPEALAEVAAEIRETIVETVARSGSGHLGASLGAVELTLALHSVFRSPQDRIVWDVGHQTYGHKLVTGRYAAFGTLRQPGGLSGFLKRRESVHDHWEAGHGGTSLSGALGMARARDLLGEDHDVVAVIGDGSLTAGMALEALDDIGHSGTRLIVVLNDNAMSISRNVGALPTYLARLRTGPAYLRLREDVHWILERVPLIGRAMVRTAERVKEGLKQMVLPGMLFEELGFTYLGPVDGHNIVAVQEILRQARQVPGPVLCHVVTVKGRGYAPAEARPEASHAWGGPFDPKSGALLSRRSGPPTYTKVFADGLVAAAAADRRIVGITAAMAAGTGIERLAERFPDRAFDVGMAEQHAVTMAAGLALAGLRPVVAIYSTFLQRAYDQIVHDVALQGLPVVFAVDRAGIVGEDGATHQGLFDLAYLRHVPGMGLIVPRDEAQLRRALVTALAREDGPTAFRYPRGEGFGVPCPEDPRPLPWGRAEVLCEHGRDCLVLAAGPLCAAALQAALDLAAEGLRVTVVDPVFVKPLDRCLADLARACGAVVTAEDHVAAGGFGSAVLEMLAAAGVTVPVRVLGVPDAFVDHGRRADLLAGFGLDRGGIAAAVRDLAAGRLFGLPGIPLPGGTGPQGR